jgi:hypothetical protein
MTSLFSMPGKILSAHSMRVLGGKALICWGDLFFHSTGKEAAPAGEKRRYLRAAAPCADFAGGPASPFAELR